jgi:site-specific DNA-cytosine methylase
VTMLDLCCGLGGASRAMRERGWRVVGVDNLIDVRPDVVADVRALPLSPFQLDLLWASPPCAEFSLWRLPWKQAIRLRREPDLSIAFAVRDEIARWRPRFWIVENVWASRPWLTPIFGQVRAMVSGHVLWGNLPGLVPQFHRFGTETKETRGPSKLRHQLRAIIPHEISLAVAIATERRVNDNG